MQVMLVGRLEELPTEAGGGSSSRVVPLVVSVEQMLALTGGVEMPLVDHADRAAWFELFTRVELAAGDVLAAAVWAARAAAAAGVGSHAVGFARLAAAQVALRQGEGRVALSEALVAARQFELAGNRLDAARARLVADAVVLSPPGSDARGAVRPSGSDHLPDDGPRTVVGSASSFDALSLREREVARLVARGWTNREIAECLYLSVKTVERYLTRSFLKLGLPSRAALAAMVARADA